MKPQDILVLIKLHLWNQERWKIIPLAESIYLSKTETQKAIKRLEKSSLFDSMLERTKKAEMEEFFLYGLKYCFPAEIGPTTRGIPTAHSASPLKELIMTNEKEFYVWPYAKGKSRGLSVSPLYKCAPLAALADSRMYNYLVLIDALRIGKAREKAFARDYLVKMIRAGNTYEA
jgi:hypothetical protein